MKKKYIVNCLAITDKHGNLHRDEKVTYDEDGNATVEPVILDADQFEPGQLDHYLKDGHLRPFESEKSSKEVTAKDKKVADLTVKYFKLSGSKSVPEGWDLKKLQDEVKKLEDKNAQERQQHEEQMKKELRSKKGA